MDLFADPVTAASPHGSRSARTQKTAQKGSDKPQMPRPFRTNLSPRYTFDNFVVGNSNRFAKAAAMAVANNPANAYNPFFLFSDSGLGKTHLMNAIGNQILATHPDMKILYISSETFTNELIESVEHNRLEAFREKYRSIDVLLIDDIQFLRNKESHPGRVLPHLQYPGKGQQTDHHLQRPASGRAGYPGRAYDQPVQFRPHRRHPAPGSGDKDGHSPEQGPYGQHPLPRDVILLIASSVTSNIRELEGAYNRVCAYASLNQEPITLELCRNALKELNLIETPRFITVETIQQVVADHFRLHLSELSEKKRTETGGRPPTNRHLPDQGNGRSIPEENRGMFRGPGPQHGDPRL